jgi:hypothetical protein
MTLQTHRLTRCAFTLVTFAMAVSLEVTGCGTSPKPFSGTQPSPSAAPSSAVILPASAETTAALGVTSWGINNKTPNGSVLIAGLDDTVHVMRGLFSADAEKDPSGGVSVSFTTIFPGPPVSITVQSKDGQIVLLSNEFPHNPGAARALELLNADFQKSESPLAGTTAMADMHPLDLVLDAGPLLCDSNGKFCAQEMANIANAYKTYPPILVNVYGLSGGCSAPCPASVVNACHDACWSQSSSRPDGADPCLHVKCSPSDETRSKNTDPDGWACVYNCNGGDYTKEAPPPTYPIVF